jgi:hypothetical protein
MLRGDLPGSLAIWVTGVRDEPFRHLRADTGGGSRWVRVAWAFPAGSSGDGQDAGVTDCARCDVGAVGAITGGLR